MLTSTKQHIFVLAILVAAASASLGQEAHTVTSSEIAKATVAASPAGGGTTARASELAPMTLVQASPVAVHLPTTVTPAQALATPPAGSSTTTTATSNFAMENGGVWCA